MSAVGAEEGIFVALEQDEVFMERYSHQIQEYGLRVVSQLVELKVLVVGLKGVGIEVAKNLILTGVGEITLWDDDEVKISDLGTNFCLKEEDVGRATCAEASLAELESLNPFVKVAVQKGVVTKQSVGDFDVVVDCGLSFDESVEVNEKCRKANTKYIRSRVHGLAGHMFVDFGEKFTIFDKTGEETVERIIDVIESDPETPGELVVTIFDRKRHNIDFDDHCNFIKIEDVKGELGELLNGEEFMVKPHYRTTSDGKQRFEGHSLRVVTGDINLENVYNKGGGKIVQVKRPVETTFSPLRESVENPVHPEEGIMMLTDASKWRRPEQLHVAMRGLWRFERDNGRLPEFNCNEDVETMINCAKEVHDEMMAKKSFAMEDEDFSNNVVTNVSQFSQCKFQPLCAFFGGVVATEVVKVTGKYTPLRQWLHLDCFEVLPEGVEMEERELRSCRYDDLIKILGRKVHERIMKGSTLVAGCGATGCEMMKNFAMIGLGCDDTGEGVITVADGTPIATSNLSSHMLCREKKDIGRPKHFAATEALKRMNEEVNVESQEKNTTTFGSDLMKSQDFLTCAMESRKDKLHVDSQCVFFEKPLLDISSLGVKANAQVIIPHKTASYADGPIEEPGSVDDFGKLRNFPTTIDHCIEWAQLYFQDLFVYHFTKALDFLKDPEGFIQAKRVKLDSLPQDEVSHWEISEIEKVINILVKTSKERHNLLELYVEEALSAFQSMFRKNILALVERKPEDTMDEDDELFWGKNRRFPTALDFDPENELHLSFISSAVKILSTNYGLEKADPELLENIVERVREITSRLAPSFDKEDDEQRKMTSEFNSKQYFQKLLKELETLAEIEDSIIEPASFAVHDNVHIDFITAASNLRAEVYNIKKSNEVEMQVCCWKD